MGTGELGTCDKKQYEHSGAHERIGEYGNKLPPFPCENWKPLCKHERLDEEGICRKCGRDCRAGD